MDRKNAPAGFNPAFIIPPQLTNMPQRIRSAAIDISGQCNMSCLYCAEAVTMPKRHPMPPETLDAVWNFLFPEGIKTLVEKNQGKIQSGMFSIHLGSGEPFLNFPLLEKLSKMVKQARSEGMENLYVFLTTNASLLDKKKMDWLVDTGWNVKISFDGPETVHDKWRVFADGRGTFRQAAEAVAYLAERMPERLAACAVLCRGTDPADVFDTVRKLGVRQVDLAPVAHHDPSIIPGPGDIEKYRKFIREYAESFIDLEYDEENETVINPPPAISIFQYCMMRLMGYNLARVICGAGRMYLAVGPDGELYPCGRMIGIDKYRVGTLPGGVNPEAIHAFCNEAGRSYELREACAACWAAPLCCGPCYACSELFGPGNGSPIDYQCAYILETAEAAVSLYNRLKSSPEKLLAFLPKLGSEFLD
jgi:uncharacterized protein